MKKSLYDYSFKLILFLIVFTIFFIGAFWFKQIYNFYDFGISWIDNNYKNEKKMVLENQVKTLIKISEDLSKETSTSELVILQQLCSSTVLSNGQVNIYDINGSCLASSGGCGNVGKIFLTKLSSDRKRYIAQGIEKAKNGGGFIEYKLIEKGVEHFKIGYFKLVPTLNVVISACQSYREVDVKGNSKHKENLMNSLIEGLFSLFVISIILSVFVFVVIRYFFAKIKKDYDYINSALLYAKDKNQILDESSIEFSEFAYMSTQINELIKSRESYESDLILQKQRADESSDAKTKFIAHMSHEIRTPMNSIFGFSGLLEMTNLSSKQSKYVQSINSSAKILLDVLNDILDVGKLDAKGATINIKSFDVVAVVAQIAQMYESLAQSKGIDFFVKIDSNINRNIFCDEAKLVQIISNLLSNALKFTNYGSVTLAVELSENNGLKFTISDTGIGIDENNFSKIFEPFEQEVSNDKFYGGAGLGLFIVTNLVKLLGAEITFKSEKFKGSEFVVEFKNIIFDELVEKNDNRTVVCQKQILGFEKKKVLIVDDKEHNRELLKEILADMDIEIYEATNGKDGLKKVMLYQPDLVLTDVIMPIMDGIKFAKEIRKTNSSLPIIAISADVTMKMVIGEEFNEMMEKPIDVIKVRALVTKYLMQNDMLCKDFELDTTQLGMLPHLLEELQKISDRAITVLETVIDYDEYAKFIKELIKINEKYDNPILKFYIDSCQNAFNDFDILKLEQKIDKFKKMLGYLKEVISEQQK